MLFIIKTTLLQFVFYAGVTFFWFLTYCLLLMEYCPTFICEPFESTVSTYDYIVVGAGSAGSVVALRLAQDNNVSVLLLEAGGSGGAILDVPTMLPMLQLSPLDWNYKTVPQKNAMKGMKNKASNWPRGKLVGGTGRFNNMIYLRGHPYDYQEWYKNKTDYNYEADILRYLKKSENHLGSYKSDLEYHGINGPLNVDDLPFTTQLSNALMSAAEQFGYPLRDLNGADNTGFMVPQANLKQGARYSTGHYLMDHLTDNLKLLTKVFVKKVLFKDKYEARGVLATKYGVDKIFKAKKGVILCGGTVNSAKLLLLSGVGPKEHLDEIGIPLIQDLPVGENLQDHVTMGTDLFVVTNRLSLNSFSLLSPLTMYDYIYNGRGAWTSIQCEFTGVLHTACIHAENFTECTSRQTGAPDLQIMALPLGMSSDYGAHLRDVIGVSDVTWEYYYRNLIDSPTISILPILLHPKSRGFIRLASKDPRDDPVIDPEYLTHPYDLETLVKGIELVKKLGESVPLKELGVKMYKKKFPGCEKYVFDTRPYWECFIRHNTLTVYHPVGTVKMGHGDDPESVVDYNFKVRNVNKLYVADASVIPYITSSNINVAVVLVAEKAADSIKFQDFLNSARSMRKNWVY